MLQVNVRAGELASPSAPQPLIVLGDVSKLRVRAEIDERDYGEIKVGQRVVVRSPAFRGRDVAGTVSSVAPIIEPGRIGARGQRSPTDVNVAEVVIDLAEPGPLAVGMKVDVYFSRRARNSASGGACPGRQRDTKWCAADPGPGLRNSENNRGPDQRCITCAAPRPGTKSTRLRYSTSSTCSGPVPNAFCASVASMNGSRSPSSTPPVSEVCTPVRRSFTIW